MRLQILVVLVPCAVTAVFFAACARSRVPGPELGDHPKGATEAVCVPYPPPAAKPEVTGGAPSERAVWVDGDWIWRGRGAPSSTAGKWEWKPGAWVEPPYGAKFARSVLVRMPNGALAWYPPHFHPAEHYELRPRVDAAGPLASTGSVLSCPEPPRSELTGVPPPLVDAGDAHVGPALMYVADAPAQAPPKLVLDAIIPSDATEPPKLIPPPE